MPEDQVDRYQRKVLLVSDRGPGIYIPIHKNPNDPYVADETNPGIPAFGVRESDQTWQPFELDGSGNLKVNATFSGAVTVGQPDESVFTEGVSDVVVLGGEYNTSISLPSSGEAAAAQITQHRALHVNQRDSSGVEIDPRIIRALTSADVVTVDQGTSPWVVDVTDTSNTVVKPGDATNNAVRVNIVAGLTQTGQVDESAFTEGVTNFSPVGGEFNDSGTFPTSGHAAAARITSKRAIHTNLRDNSGNEVDPRQIRSLTAADIITVNQGTTPWNATIGDSITLSNIRRLLEFILIELKLQRGVEDIC